MQSRPTESLRCAFCHGPADTVVECPRCGAVLHNDCWLIANKCPTLACTWASPHVPKRRRRWRLVVFLLLASLVTTVLVHGDPWLYFVWGHAPFDSKLWRRPSPKAVPNNNADWRVPMVYDLLHNQGLVGRTRAEVCDLLGESEEAGGYWVGGAGGISIYWCLVLEYDGDRVSGYHWVDVF